MKLSSENRLEIRYIISKEKLLKIISFIHKKDKFESFVLDIIITAGIHIMMKIYYGYSNSEFDLLERAILNSIPKFKVKTNPDKFTTDFRLYRSFNDIEKNSTSFLMILFIWLIVQVFILKKVLCKRLSEAVLGDVIMICE